MLTYISLHETHALVCNSFIENMKLKLALKRRCPLKRRAELYFVWFTETQVHGNKQLDTITTD